MNVKLLCIRLTETKLNGLPGNFTINWKAKFVSHQTFTSPECYFDLLSFDDFFGEEKFSWLHLKNEVADENLHFSCKYLNYFSRQCSVLELT